MDCYPHGEGGYWKYWGKIHGNHNILCKLNIIQYNLCIWKTLFGMGSIAMANMDGSGQKFFIVSGSVGVDYHHGEVRPLDRRMEGAMG